MNRQNPHERFAELAAGYALSALEPEDEQLFLAHLPGCASCGRDLTEHRGTLAHLAYAPEVVEPPASLLAGIRAGVLASGRGVTFPDVTAPIATDSDGTTSLDAARARRADAAKMRRAGAWTSIAAAAALVVGLGVWNVSLQSGRDEQFAQGDRLAAAVRELGEVGTDSVPLALADGQVVAVALMNADRLSLLIDGLDPNDTATTTYVLWGKSRYGDVRPVAAFDVTENGLHVREGMQMKAGVADVTMLMVTHEPGRAAPPIPTQPVLASGAV